jgi:ribosome recycling factor
MKMISTATNINGEIVNVKQYAEEDMKCKCWVKPDSCQCSPPQPTEEDRKKLKKQVDKLNNENKKRLQ